MRRVGRPGLIGLAARTAVVAGTANAVNNRAANRRDMQQQQLAAQEEQRQFLAQQQYAQQQQQYLQQQQYAAQREPEPAAAPTSGLTAEIMKLADLKKQGLLTDEEFAAAKAKLLEG